MLNKNKPSEILELEKVYKIRLEENDGLSKNTYVLDENKNVISLNLSGNQISEIKNLEKLSSLQALYLSEN